MDLKHKPASYFIFNTNLNNNIGQTKSIIIYINLKLAYQPLRSSCLGIINKSTIKLTGLIRIFLGDFLCITGFLISRARNFTSLLTSLQ